MSTNAAQNLNSKHAWREVERANLPKRSAAKRVADFQEIYGPYDEVTAQEQAARCVQCPEPPCVQGCPLSNRIPEWLGLTAEGQFLEAAASLHSTNNLPEICARMCPTERLCEGHCILDGTTKPVAIGAIEGFLNEYAFAHGSVDLTTASPKGQRVAVVGSGPGGLTCADVLAKRGYSVTVFDSKRLPGGLLVNGITAFKVDKSIVHRRIEVLKKMGVIFRLGVTIGKEVTLGELRVGFHAVFVGAGAPKARSIHIPGADLKHVIQALPFINQKSADMPLERRPFKVTGKRVVVIGGGDTAVDCLRTAIRRGAREALCVYRRDEASMPCGQVQHNDALEEHIQFLCQAAPIAILGDHKNRVTGLRLVRTELGATGADGRPEFKLLSGTEFEIPADWVILALGFEPLSFPPSSDFGNLKTGESGGLLVDDHHMTDIPGLFAGGSMVQGSSMVASTIRDARQAADEIDRYLCAQIEEESSRGA